MSLVPSEDPREQLRHLLDLLVFLPGIDDKVYWIGSHWNLVPLADGLNAGRDPKRSRLGGTDVDFMAEVRGRFLFMETKSMRSYGCRDRRDGQRIALGALTKLLHPDGRPAVSVLMVYGPTNEPRHAQWLGGEPFDCDKATLDSEVQRWRETVSAGNPFMKLDPPTGPR